MRTMKTMRGETGSILKLVKMRFVLPILLLSIPLDGDAGEVYRWIAPNGTTCYGDQRPLNRPCTPVRTPPEANEADYRRRVERARAAEQQILRRQIEDEKRAQARVEYAQALEKRKIRCTRMHQEIVLLRQIWTPVVPVPKPDGRIGVMTKAERLSRIQSLYDKGKTECPDASAWENHWQRYFPPHTTSRHILPPPSTARDGPSIPSSRQRR